MDQLSLNWKHILSTSVQKNYCFQNLFLNQQAHLLKSMSQGCKGQFIYMYSFIFSFLCKIKLQVTPFQLLVSIYLQHKVVDKVVEYFSGYCFCSEKKIIKTPPHLPLPKDMIVVQVGIMGNKKHQLTCMSALFVLSVVCYGEISLACSQPGDIFMPSTRDKVPLFHGHSCYSKV